MSGRACHRTSSSRSPSCGSSRTVTMLPAGMVVKGRRPFPSDGPMARTSARRRNVLPANKGLPRSEVRARSGGRRGFVVLRAVRSFEVRRGRYQYISTDSRKDPGLRRSGAEIMRRSQPSAEYSSAGSVKRKVLPRPSSDSTVRRPPCISTIRLHSARPMPVPGYSRPCSRLNGSKMRSW